MYCTIRIIVVAVVVTLFLVSDYLTSTTEGPACGFLYRESVGPYRGREGAIS
jgi:hypothetical protein